VLHAVCALPLDATSARCARDEVGIRCREWRVEADALETAQLLVSELVGNAVRHAGGAHQLTIDLSRSALRLSVTDAHNNCALLPTKQDLDSENGRGLWIIDLLASRWGCVPDGHGGKTVWCQLRTISAPLLTRAPNDMCATGVASAA
jgi:anti-sigma regulatory factor (Ser/Thr protein kinase)